MLNSRANAISQRGIALVEVLVATLILTIGILGMAGLQLQALKFNQIAVLRSQATFFAYDISDRMRANRSAALAGNYDISISAVAPTGSVQYQTDLSDWKTALANGLPGGGGAISRNGRVFTITVRWDESRAGGSSTQEFSLETRL